MQLKKSKNQIENTNNLRLSIQFSLDGFSFCIQDDSIEKTVYFCEANFTSSLSKPEELLEKIRPVFKSEKELQYDFKAVHAYYKNDLYTVVPEAFFDEEKLSNYLQHTVKTYPTDLFAYDTIEGINAKLIYIPYVNINNFLFQNFGEFEFSHYQTLFLNKLIAKNDSNQLNIYVDIDQSLMNILVLQGKELSLANTFQCSSAIDRLYYLLFTAEQLNLDSSELKVFVSGKISERTETYQLFKKYIRHIEFNTAKSEIFDFFSGSKHEHFALLDS